MRTMCVCVFASREKRLREEIEKYRQERPKIQQQFSDLKVTFFNSLLAKFNFWHIGPFARVDFWHKHSSNAKWA